MVFISYLYTLWRTIWFPFPYHFFFNKCFFFFYYYFNVLFMVIHRIFHIYIEIYVISHQHMLNNTQHHASQQHLQIISHNIKGFFFCFIMHHIVHVWLGGVENGMRQIIKKKKKNSKQTKKNFPLNMSYI